MKFDIRQLTAADAERLAGCFERCYGRTYPNETFYDAAAIARLVNNGVLKSVVAVAADGIIVGHTGLTLHDPSANVTEAGNTVVDPDYRGQGILGEMGAALAELCGASGFVGYVHYPTTAHEIMQKRSVTNGGVETGVMLGFVPADTDYREIQHRPGRIAATIVYQPLADAPPLSIFVSRRYEAVLGRLYGQMGLRRERVRSAERARLTTACTTTRIARRSLLNVRVEHAGSDLSTRIDQLTQTNVTELVHVDLILDDPGVDRAVDDLIKLGFIYCGLLPAFARSDVLRLQYLRDQPPAVFAPALANSDARSLLAFINSERLQPGA